VSDFPLQVPASPGLSLRLRRAGASAGKLRLLRGQVLAHLSDSAEHGLVQLRQDVKATDLMLHRTEDLENQLRIRSEPSVVMPRSVNPRLAKATWNRWKNARISP